MSQHPSNGQDLPPRPEALSKIRHIVVVMLENRSFDNLLGWLYADEPPPRGQHFEGLTDEMWNPLQVIDLDGNSFTEKVYVRRNGHPPRYSGGSAAKRTDLRFDWPDPDPGEGFRDMNYQLYGRYEVAENVHAVAVEASNLGFVDNYLKNMTYWSYCSGAPYSDPREIMTCYLPEQVPVLSTLAREFAVCDHWHSSIPSETVPNRNFVHTATSCGRVNNYPIHENTAETIYAQIQKAIDEGRDLSWRIFCDSPWPHVRTSLEWLSIRQLQEPRFTRNVRHLEEFYDAAAKGRLPSYSFIEPDYSTNDQHPPKDIRPGEKFLADIYRAVVSSPQWEETMLVITYDEAGGCFDHLPPPTNAIPPEPGGPPGQFGFRFDRFGPRVPTVVVSPYIEGGGIVRPANSSGTPFDHTSIIATVRNCFDLEGHLTRRDAAAPDLSCVLTLSEPRSDKPQVHPLAVPEVPEHGQEASDLQRLIASLLADKLGAHPPKDDKKVAEFVLKAFEKLQKSSA